MTSDTFRVVAGTGHRRLERGDRAWVSEQLPRAAAWLRDQAGTEVGISGLGYDFDLEWGETILDAGLTLWVAIPFEGQAANWNHADQRRWRRLRDAAGPDGRRLIGRLPHNLPPTQRRAYATQLMHARNRAMLAASDAVLTVWEPGRLDGGTAATLLEAARRQMPGVHLDPVNRAVHFRLPDVDQLQKLALEHAGCKHILAVGARADVAARHAVLTAAGYQQWQIRPAASRERHHTTSCDRCRIDPGRWRAAARDLFPRPGENGR